jgi:hypothetical protein
MTTDSSGLPCFPDMYEKLAQLVYKGEEGKPFSPVNWLRLWREDGVCCSVFAK